MNKLAWGSGMVLGLSGLAIAADRHYVPMAPESVRSGRAGAYRPAAMRGPGVLIRTTQAIGDDVKDSEGKALGRIRDLVIDTARKRITVAAVSLNDNAKTRHQYYAVPWTALTKPANQSTESTREAFTLDMDAERLAQAPGFDAKRWPDVADQRWNRDVYAFYGQGTPGAQPTLQGEPISNDSGKKHGKSSRSSRSAESGKPLMLKVNGEMIGHRVRHAWNNELIGEINDLIVDRHTGDVAFIVLHLDPGTSVTQLQSEKDYVALPAAMFLLDRNGDPNAPFTVECCLEKLKTHRFRGDDWPNLASRGWATSLYDDFGRTPYWEQR